MSDNFLSRWSRRKEAARRVGDGLAPPSDDAAQRVPSVAQQHTHDPQALATEAAITPEEMAALPKVDDLTADSDISGFLRRGVPDDLRNAALRRIWMLDPAIRDFVGHARDYAYDWNTPGGVPGNGTLPPDADVTAMLRQVFGESDSDAPTYETLAQRISPDRHVLPGPVVDDVPSAAMQEDGAREELKPASADKGTEAERPLTLAVTTAIKPSGAERSRPQASQRPDVTPPRRALPVTSSRARPRPR